MPDMESHKEKELLEGFPQTSDFIAKDPAKTTIIVRRFDQLAVRNLLHLEARLAALEALQKEYDRHDAAFNNDNEPITTAARSWEDFAVIGSWKAKKDGSLKAREDGSSNPMKEEATGGRRTSRHDSPHYLPESVLARWRITRGMYVEKLSLQGLKHIDVGTTDLNKLYNASVEAELVLEHDMFGLAQQAAIEAKKVYNNLLGCGPFSLALIRSRWELSAAIETSLKEYQEAVLRYREMLKLEPPAERTRTVVSAWIAGVPPESKSEDRSIAIMSRWLVKVYHQITEGFGESSDEETSEIKQQFLPTSAMHEIYAGKSSLSSSNEGIVGEPSPDFVSVGRIAGVDLLTRWVSRWRLLYIFKDQNFEYPEIDYVPEKVIHYTVTLLMVFLAGVMVIGTIWGLFLLRTLQGSLYAALVLLSGLTILFAFLMRLVTMSSRTGLFVATASYAALLAVFVADQSFGFILNRGTSGNDNNGR